MKAAIITPDKDIVPGSKTYSPAYLVFSNYEKILMWNRSLRFALAVCKLKINLKMKFKYFILLFFLCNCAQNIKISSDKKSYYSKGFAYIYNDKDFTNKIISKKLNNEFLQISNNKLRSGVLIKIINTKTQDAIILKNKSNIKYPEFYKILITEAVAQKIKT